MKKKLRIIAIALAAAAAVAFAGSTQASASDVRVTATVQPSPNTVGTKQIIDAGIWGPDIHDNTIPLAKMGYDFRKAIEAANVSKPNAISSSNQIAPGTVAQSDLEAGLSNKINAALTVPNNYTYNYAPTPIAKIGGTFATRATKLGEFQLTEGTWDIRTRMRADRVNVGTADYVAPTTDTMPMLALRAPGEDLATIMGNAISRAGRTELTGADYTTLVVADNQTTTVEVWAFGYNEDTSAFGSDDDGATTGKPQFTMSAQVKVFQLEH